MFLILIFERFNYVEIEDWLRRIGDFDVSQYISLRSNPIKSPSNTDRACVSGDP